MANQCDYTVEPGTTEGQKKDAVAKRSGVVSAVFCRVLQFWPVRVTMRAFRGVWWFFGFSSTANTVCPVNESDSPRGRQCRTVRKRLHRVTRVMLAFLPRGLQSFLGYPTCTSIGCAVSPEVSCSPTKPCGKGSKRKQDDLDEEEEVELHSWVEALNQELSNEDHPADLDYEPSSVETDSEEYQSHNDTESDLEREKGVVIIKDLETVVPPEA